MSETEVAAGTDDDRPEAAYAFRVEFRLEADVDGVWADPDRFETVVYRTADPPGEPGWLFFRDNCWRGELSDAAGFRGVVQDAFAVTVSTVEFSELQTTAAYFAELKATIGENLSLFNAESTTAVLSKYLGSSIRVLDG
jgi:hypothetical protein